MRRILRTATTHPSRFVSYETELDLSELAEALEPQGYLPMARQIQGQEGLFGADFLSGAAQKNAGSAGASRKNPAQASGTHDLLEPAPHEPFEA